ncbi:MAG: RIP metalloprotease RseP [Candidatus Bipolaricaulaceae bacterium]
MTTLLLFLGTILLLIGIHEGGHFLAAKLLGVAVEEFAIGFGPTLWSRRRGETRYSLRLLPLGGFVRLAGEEGSADQVDFARTYYGRPAWVRLTVSLAGPVANLVLAAVLATGALAGFGLPRVQVAGVASDAPADQVLQVGDVVLAVGGRPIWSWEEVGGAIQAGAPGPVSFRVRRQGKVQVLEITPEWEAAEERYLVGAYFSPQVLLAEVTDLAADAPLRGAGLEAGDRVVAACDRPVATLAELYGELDEGCRTLQVERGGRTLTVELPPTSTDALLTGATFAALPPAVDRPGVATAATLAARQLAGYFVALFATLQDLVSGQVAAGEAVAGPVGIAGLLGQGLRAGGLATLLLIAFISMNLAAFNLIPFPALDGARMGFALYEIVTRRKVSPRVEAAVHALGFAVLLGLLVLITYRDLVRLFG